MEGSELVARADVESAEKEEGDEDRKQKNVIHKLASPTIGSATAIIGQGTQSGNQ